MKKNLLFLIFFCFYATFSIASASELSNHLDNIKTMQAHFTQTTHDKKGKAIQQSYGRK